jgi:hypothetical protein
MELNDLDRQKVSETLSTLKAKSNKRWCRDCGESIQMRFEQDRLIPFDLDGTPHWKTCPYSGFVQKKCSFAILRKMIVHICLKHNVDLENDLGLTKHEILVVRSMLESMLKATAPAPAAEVVQAIVDDCQFKPVPCDPIGDPDEERAPNENLIHDAERILQDEPSRNIGFIKAKGISNGSDV